MLQIFILNFFRITVQDVCHDEFYWPLGSYGLLEVGICWVVFWLQTFGNDYLVFNWIFGAV